MADRYDIERERDRERRGEWDRNRDWDRNREWDRDRDWGRDVGGDRTAGRAGNWDWDRRSEYSGEGPRGGHEGHRWEDREQRERRWSGGWGEGRHRDERDWNRENAYNQRGGDEGWRGSRYAGSERTADWAPRGDWGSQGRWGAYGNRADYDRENTFREDPALRSARVESDWSGPRTGRTNLYGTGGGGFGSGMASYGAGMGGGFEGTANYGGGMGRYAGRGPKGWQRSDDRIREDINERLTDHPHIDASEIEVQVNNGEVTLSGAVDERQYKRLAEDIAESVSGVREVHNNIRIQQRDTAKQGSEPHRGSASTQSRNK